MLPEGSSWSASFVTEGESTPMSFWCCGTSQRRFQGLRLYKAVDFEVRAGEIHALVGQNGSGKSTLVKILAGVHQPDPGAEGWLDGEPLDLDSAAVAKHGRLRFVHQDLGLVLELSTAENLALFRGFQRGRFGRLRWGEQAEITHRVLARFGIRHRHRCPAVRRHPGGKDRRRHRMCTAGVG